MDNFRDGDVCEKVTPAGAVEAVAIRGAVLLIGDPCVCLDMDTTADGERPLLVTSISGWALLFSEPRKYIVNRWEDP